jgi:hypothetical protein
LAGAESIPTFPANNQAIKLFHTLLYLTLSTAAVAQSASLLMGARATGLGYSTACLADEWSVMNNPGGLADVKSLTFSASQNLHPYLKSFNRVAGIFVIPVGKTVCGLGVYRFGDELYNEQVASAVFSNRFGLASLGLKINYVQYFAEGFGTRGVFTVSFGGVATLTPQLMLGAHITNINQPTISSNYEEKIPTRLSAGMALKASEKVLLTTEIEKDLDRKMIWKTGIEYQFNKKFFFRTAFNVDPDAAFLGVGFSPRNFAVAYAFQYELNAGMNHQATVAYKILRK